MPEHAYWAAPAAAAVLLLGVEAAVAQRAGGLARSARADLADAAQGSYFGEIVSDARGSSRSDVRVLVTKVGPNRVQVTSDHARLPAFTAQLIRATDTLRNAGGEAVFLLDLSKRPPTLLVTVDDASWAGSKE